MAVCQRPKKVNRMIAGGLGPMEWRGWEGRKSFYLSAIN